MVETGEMRYKHHTAGLSWKQLVASGRDQILSCLMYLRCATVSGVLLLRRGGGGLNSRSLRENRGGRIYILAKEFQDAVPVYS